MSLLCSMPQEPIRWNFAGAPSPADHKLLMFSRIWALMGCTRMVTSTKWRWTLWPAHATVKAPSVSHTRLGLALVLLDSCKLQEQAAREAVREHLLQPAIRIWDHTMIYLPADQECNPACACHWRSVGSGKRKRRLAAWADRKQRISSEGCCAHPPVATVGDGKGRNQCAQGVSTWRKQAYLPLRLA